MYVSTYMYVCMLCYAMLCSVLFCYVMLCHVCIYIYICIYTHTMFDAKSPLETPPKHFLLAEASPAEPVVVAQKERVAQPCGAEV